MRGRPAYPPYLAHMVQAGKLAVTEPLSPLLSIDTALAAFAEHQGVSMVTRQEAHEAQTRSEKVGARIDLDNGRAPTLPLPSAPPLQRCPSMPAGVRCVEVEVPTLDIMPKLAASEVLYFQKHDCGPCQPAAGAVGRLVVGCGIRAAVDF